MKVVALRTASPRTIALVAINNNIYTTITTLIRGFNLVGEESFDLQDTAWRPNLQRRPH